MSWAQNWEALIQGTGTGGLECRGHTGKYKKDGAGKVGLGQSKDLETTALTLDLSTGSSLSLPACPIPLLAASRPWLP